MEEDGTFPHRVTFLALKTQAVATLISLILCIPCEVDGAIDTRSVADTRGVAYTHDVVNTRSVKMQSRPLLYKYCSFIIARSAIAGLFIYNHEPELRKQTKKTIDVARLAQAGIQKKKKESYEKNTKKKRNPNLGVLFSCPKAILPLHFPKLKKKKR